MDIPEYGLIIANDETDVTRAETISQIVAPFVDGIKIAIANEIESLRKRLDLIEAAKKTGKVVIADFKIADIGHKNKEGKYEGTNRKTVETLANCGADYITAHVFPGTESIKEAVETAHRMGVKILALPYMTAKGAELFFGHPLDKKYAQGVLDKLNMELDLTDCETISDLILEIGEAVAVDGYIGPSNVPEVLRNYRKHTDRIVCGPGFGRQDRLNRDISAQLNEYFGILGENSAAIVGSFIYGPKDLDEVQKQANYVRSEIDKLKV